MYAAMKSEEMHSQLTMAVVVEAFDGGLLERAVHPFDLSANQGMIAFGQPFLSDACCAANR